MTAQDDNSKNTGRMAREKAERQDRHVRGMEEGRAEMKIRMYWP